MGAVSLVLHSFQSIRTMYNVPLIAQCITTEKPIAETLRINEAHVFFLENAPENVMYDFFYTKEFIVEVGRQFPKDSCC